MGLRQMMRRFPDAAAGEAPFAPYLEDGEALRHVAYAVRMPGFFGALLLQAMGGGGAILNAASHYLLGLTDRRLIVLRIENVGHAVKNVTAWPLDALPPAKFAKGWMEIADPANPIKAFVHPTAVPGHPDALQAITAALTGDAAT